jgi:protein-disulfide isomerase
MSLDSRFIVWSALALVIVSCGLAATADRTGESASGTPGKASPGDTVAEVDGMSVSASELDERVKDRMLKIRQEEYDLKRESLDELINNRLIEKEAKARGITSEQLLKAEIDDKSKPVTTADAEKFYDENQGQMQGRSKQEMVPQLMRYLQQQRLGEDRQRYLSTLRKNGKVRVKLEAPRRTIENPPDAPVLGPKDAPVTIVEFTDYQCPYCQKAQATIDELLKDYEGKVKMISRDFPLEFHPRAIFASRGSRCAGEQNRYWEYHQDLLRKPTDYSDPDLERRAGELKLDVAAFKTCMASNKYDAAIKADEAAGRAYGVEGTPAFFINGRFINGARPKQQFAAIIDEELERARN